MYDTKVCFLRKTHGDVVSVLCKYNEPLFFYNTLYLIYVSDVFFFSR